MILDRRKLFQTSKGLIRKQKSLITDCQWLQQFRLIKLSLDWKQSRKELKQYYSSISLVERHAINVAAQKLWCIWKTKFVIQIARKKNFERRSETVFRSKIKLRFFCYRNLYYKSTWTGLETYRISIVEVCLKFYVELLRTAPARLIENIELFGSTKRLRGFQFGCVPVQRWVAVQPAKAFVH